ncbi:MAG: RidA family protein [Candidatus Limivicinus sp.]
MDIYERLRELNIELPPAPPPGGLYAPVKFFGDKLIYTSGVGPTDTTGSPVYVGKVGAELTLEEGQAAARLATINLLSVLHAQLGDLNRIKQIVKQLGFVACTPDFYQQPAVMNGSTQLLMQVLGDPAGRPARSAIATNVLPGNIPVEIELLIELND